MATESLTLAMAEGPGADAWSAAEQFECEVNVEIKLPKFTVRDLLMLDRESVVDTRWSQGTDMPLRVNGELVAWTQFEVVGDRLAVRVTDLA